MARRKKTAQSKTEVVVYPFVILRRDEDLDWVNPDGTPLDEEDERPSLYGAGKAKEKRKAERDEWDKNHKQVAHTTWEVVDQCRTYDDALAAVKDRTHLNGRMYTIVDVREGDTFTIQASLTKADPTAPK